MGEEKKPAHVFKLGRIRAAIWRNQAANQDVWFNVRISRRYKEDDLWKDSESFGHEDLPVVAKAAEMAYSWIWRRQMARDKARLGTKQ